MNASTDIQAEDVNPINLGDIYRTKVNIINEIKMPKKRWAEIGDELEVVNHNDERWVMVKNHRSEEVFRVTFKFLRKKKHFEHLNPSGGE